MPILEICIGRDSLHPTSPMQRPLSHILFLCVVSRAYTGHLWFYCRLCLLQGVELQIHSLVTKRSGVPLLSRRVVICQSILSLRTRHAYGVEVDCESATFSLAFYKASLTCMICLTSAAVVRSVRTPCRYSLADGQT